VVFPAVFGDAEIKFGARVSRRFVWGADEGSAGVGGLEEELVVAYKSDDFFVEVHCIFAKHLAAGDVPCPGELLGQKVDGALVGCHEVII